MSLFNTKTIKAKNLDLVLGGNGLGTYPFLLRAYDGMLFHPLNGMIIFDFTPTIEGDDDFTPLPMMITKDQMEQHFEEVEIFVEKNGLRYEWSNFYKLVNDLGGVEQIQRKLKTELMSAERHYLTNIMDVHNLFNQKYWS